MRPGRSQPEDAAQVAGLAGASGDFRWTDLYISPEVMEEIRRWEISDHLSPEELSKLRQDLEDSA